MWCKILLYYNFSFPGIIETVAATCPIQSRSRQVSVTVSTMPDTVDTVIWAPCYGWRYHPKHVEQFADVNKLYIVASFWIIIDTYYAMYRPLNIKDIMSLQEIPSQQQKTEKFILFRNNIPFNLHSQITALCMCTRAHVKMCTLCSISS